MCFMPLSIKPLSNGLPYTMSRTLHKPEGVFVSNYYPDVPVIVLVTDTLYYAMLPEDTACMESRSPELYGLL